MSYTVIKFFSFECDHGGCRVSDHVQAESLEEAVRQIQDAGWTSGPGWHYCGQHFGPGRGTSSRETPRLDHPQARLL